MNLLPVPVDALPSPLNLISAGLMKEKWSLGDTPQWFSKQSGKREGYKFHSWISNGQMDEYSLLVWLSLGSDDGGLENSCRNIILVLYEENQPLHFIIHMDAVCWGGSWDPVKLGTEGLAHGTFHGSHMGSTSKHREKMHVFKRKRNIMILKKRILEKVQWRLIISRAIQRAIFRRARNEHHWSYKLLDFEPQDKPAMVVVVFCFVLFFCELKSCRFQFMQLFVNSVLTLLFIRH